MREHLTAIVEWKAATTGDPGELEGYFSVFGNVDQGDDVVLPGAFKKTLTDWSSSKQPLPLIADHELSTEGVIGSVVNAKEDGTGGRFRAKFSSDPKAQSIRKKMIEGHIRGISFTYEAVKHYMGTVAGKSVRFLQELRVFEVTVTPFPMNTLALASAKSEGEQAAASMTFTEFSDAMRSALGINYEPARKAAVDLIVGAYHLDTAAGPGDGQATAEAAAPDEGTAEETPVESKAADYALQLINPSGPRDGAPNGEPPSVALAGPLAPLEIEREAKAMDRLEAEIQQQLGRS